MVNSEQNSKAKEMKTLLKSADEIFLKIQEERKTIVGYKERKKWVAVRMKSVEIKKLQEELKAVLPKEEILSYF